MKSSKLRFKNTDPSSTSSKKKSHKRKQNHLQSSTHSNDSDNKGNSVRSAWQITHQTPNGPTLLLSSQTNQPSCLFAHPESTKISFREQQIVIDNFEPTEVEQVFFVSILPGSKIKYSLKSFNDKYLGCDAFGVCSCTREAIGLQEEFEIEQVEGGFAFKTMYDKYLSIDLTTTTITQEDGLGVLIQQISKMSGMRGDAHEVNSLSTFSVKCQTDYLQRINSKREDIGEEYAIDLIKKYSTINTRNMVFTNDHMDTFKKAKQSGKLHETLLNQRETLKADKFCK